MKYARSEQNDVELETTVRAKLSDFRDVSATALCPRYVRLLTCSGGGRGGNKCVQQLSHGKMHIDYYEYNHCGFVMERRTFLLAASELFDQVSESHVC